MLTHKLTGKVALITGGNSGIGRATAALFAQEGAQVMIAARNQDKTARTVERIEELGGTIRSVACDVRDPADCENAVAETIRAFGGLHIVFNNAGIVPFGTILDTDDATWIDAFATNVHGTFYMSRAAIRYLVKHGGGVIVNNASDWGVVGGQGATCYAATKGAVVQMTRSIALDYGRQGIRVNAICPGDTFVARWREDGRVTDEESLRAMGAAFPLGRVGDVDEIARAVLFLASDDSSYMTGQLLIVDGGNTAGGASTHY
jgi:NAD(P)-dependent dehydrogenase (short-subunit alcohol dehydrogenase family)